MASTGPFAVSQSGRTIPGMATGSSRETNREWSAAVDLANHVAAGSDLPTLASPVLLDADELLHANLPADGWRYDAADVNYVEPHAAAIGGPFVFGLVAAASAVTRRRAHKQAEALAVPEWRPLGPVRILATDRRLIVWYDGAWASVWYDAIRELRPALEVARLDLTFENDPPYAVAGPWVPYLTVVITTVLARHRGVAAVQDALSLHISG